MNKEKKRDEEKFNIEKSRNTFTMPNNKFFCLALAHKKLRHLLGAGCTELGKHSLYGEPVL